MLLDTGKSSKEAPYAKLYEKLPNFVKDMVPRLDIGSH